MSRLKVVTPPLPSNLGSHTPSPAAISMHGRANQQLVISYVVPPPYPHHSKISWRRGLCWRTPSGRFSVTQRIERRKYGCSLRRSLLFPRSPSNHGWSRPRLQEQRVVFVFLHAFYFRRVPPSACAGLWCATSQRWPAPSRSLNDLCLKPKTREEWRNTKEWRVFSLLLNHW